MSGFFKFLLRIFSTTLVLIIINLIVFLFSAFLSGSIINISPLVLKNMGGNLAILTLTGDYWRLLTSIFLHGGLMHLAMNMYMLLIVGAIAERIYSRCGMLCIYIVGGLWASYASALWHVMDLYTMKTIFIYGIARDVSVLNQVVSIGASGAIMALCGALLSASLQSVQGLINKVAGNSKKGLGFTGSLVLVIAINVFSGSVIEGIDQAAHIGGAAAGFILGYIIRALPMQAGKQIYLKRLFFALLIGLGILALLFHFLLWPEVLIARQKIGA